MQALHGGTLRLQRQDDGLVCSALDREPHLVWPEGFTTDGATVYDTQKQVVASTGQPVQVSGGYGFASSPDPCGPTGQAWLVGEVVQGGK
jgi:hypothetical protein